MATAKEKTEPNTFEKDGRKRSAATARLKKAFALYMNPGTDGERDAAWAKVEEILPRVSRCVHFGHQNSNDISCMSCSGIVKEICDHKNKLRLEEDAARKKALKEKSGKRGRRSAVLTQTFINFVGLFKKSKDKNTILKAMTDSGMTESAAKSLYSKLSCLSGAMNNMDKKNSTVYQSVRYFTGKTQEKPTGDQSSISFSKKFCEAWARAK